MDNVEKKLEVLFALEKYEDVLKLAFENIYKSEMDELLFYNYIVVSHINLGNYDKALELCNEAIGIYPDEAFLFQLRAKIHLNSEKFKLAQTDIDNSLVLNPNDAKSYFIKARVYLENRNVVDAKKTIDKALEIDTSNLDFHILNAMILYMLDGEKVAKEIIDEVLQKDPNNIKALDVKQNFFTSNLHAKKSILMNLLFLNPFEKSHQADLKFIQNYYRYIPVSMVIVATLSFLLHTNRAEYGFLASFLPWLIIFIALIGSNDWRFNFPFLATMIGINIYFTNIPDGFKAMDFFVITFLAVVIHFFMMAVFPFTVLWKNRVVKILRGDKWMKN